MFVYKKQLLAAALAAITWQQCSADNRLDYRVVGSSVGAPTTASLLVSGARVRLDDSSGQWMLFHGDKNELFIVSDEKRQWYRVEDNEIARLREQMAKAKQDWEIRIAQLPQGQQEMARAALKEMAGGNKPPLSIRGTGKQDSVLGRSCDKKELLAGDQVKQRICVSTPETVGFSAAEFASVRGMYALIESMRSASGMAQADPMASLDAVPLRIEDVESGETQLLQSVSQKPLDPGQFELPVGYSPRRLSDDL